MISFERASIRWFDLPLDVLLKQPQGAVGRHLRTRGEVFVAAARAQAGVQTGMLRASIRIMQHDRAAYGQIMKIGSDVRHALWHHQGTRPHAIVGRRVLRFVKNGKVVFAHKVAHPGTRPNKYLSDNLGIFLV